MRRYGHIAAKNDWYPNRIYIFGGKQGKEKVTEGNVMVLNLDTKTWSKRKTKGTRFVEQFELEGV